MQMNVFCSISFAYFLISFNVLHIMNFLPEVLMFGCFVSQGVNRVI